MTSFDDDVLGTVSVRRNALSRSIRMRLSARGEVTVTAPKLTPMAVIKRAVRQSRTELADIRNAAKPAAHQNGDAIGHSHTLAVVLSSMSDQPTVVRKDRTIIATLPSGTTIADEHVQSLIRAQVVAVLRKEAKAYLPKRLATLARRHDYHYETVRFPHAISRWGSCSSSGTISLNISLMKLPLELIDYVILHELSHTRHMNHSAEFWSDVADHNPHYKLHRKQIRNYSPII